MPGEIFIGVDRRRRWSVEQKLAIVSEVGVAGARVADVARRHEISRQHIYAWRRELQQKGVLDRPASRLVPVEIEDELAPETTPTAAGRTAVVEIGLGNGRHIRAAADLAPDLLIRLIRAVEAA